MRRPRSFTSEEIVTICERYEEEGSRALAKEFKVRKSVILDLVKLHSIPLKKAGRPANERDGC